MGGIAPLRPSNRICRQDQPPKKSAIHRSWKKNTEPAEKTEFRPLKSKPARTQPLHEKKGRSSGTNKGRGVKNGAICRSPLVDGERTNQEKGKTVSSTWGSQVTNPLV